MPKKKGVSPKTKKRRMNSLSGLEQLFGSKTRFALLKLFCKNDAKKFFVRELARAIGGQLNAIRREVANLESLGVLKSVDTDDSKKKFYTLNKNFVLSEELYSLINKSDILSERSLIEKIAEVGDIHLCVITDRSKGINIPCDILIVGLVNKTRLATAVREFELEIAKPITYAVFSPEEYEHRKSLTDKFLFTVLEAKKNVAIDKNNEFNHEF